MTGEQIWFESFKKLSFVYADEYRLRPKNFIVSFLKYGSIRSACSDIVMVYKRIGAYDECTGDFTEWANKQNLDEKWKIVLADILKIIHSIIKK